MQRLGFDAVVSTEAVTRYFLIPEGSTSYLEHKGSVAAKNRRRPNQPPVFLIVVNAQTERSISHSASHCEDNLMPILILGRLFRARTGEFGCIQTAVLPGPVCRNTELFAFLTGHLSLPPADAIYRHIVLLFVVMLLDPLQSTQCD